MDLSRNQSTEINFKACREEVFRIISLKTVLENLNLVKNTIKQTRIFLYMYFVYGTNTGMA